MNHKLPFRALLILPSIFAGCVNVDEEVSRRPSELWKAPPPAMIGVSKGSEKLPAMPDTATASVGLQPLDLPILIDIALENNPSTRVSWFAAKSRAAEHGQSLSTYYPYLTLDASLTWQEQKNKGGFVDSNQWTSYGPTLSMNWLLFNCGQREALADAAREALFAANFTYNQTYQDTLLSVMTAYYDLNAAEATLLATEALLENTLATLDAADKRLESGLGNKQDALRAFASVKSAEAQIQQNLASIEQQRALLAQSIGIEVGANLEIVTPTHPPSFSELDESVSTLIALSLKNRPAVLEAYAVIREADFNLDAAQAALWPAFNAGASGSYLGSNNSTFDPSQDYQAFITMEWDIFEGFNKKYAIQSARSLAREARQDLRSQELQVLSEVWTFFFSFRSTIKEVEANRSAVLAQEEAYEAINIGFQTGINSFLDLLTAQQDLDLSRQNLIQAEADLSISVANLAHSVGAIPTVAQNSANRVNSIPFNASNEEDFWQQYFGGP